MAIGIRAILVAAGIAATTVTAASAATYSGNGGTGFGGSVGNSTLTVTDGGATIDFSIDNADPLFDGNNLVLYFDTVAGGVNDNSTLTDVADGGRRAISGLADSGRSLVTLPAGFTADYAASAEIGSFAGLFNLSTPASFGFVSSGGIAGTNAGPVTFSFNKADLGLAGGGTLNFVGTLISSSAFRSNETIGTSTTLPDPLNLGTAPNAGFTGTQVFATGNSFAVAAVPEPTTLAALAGVALVALRRRRATA